MCHDRLHAYEGGQLQKSEGNGDGGLFKGILVRYLTELIQSGHLSADQLERCTEFLRQNALSLYRHIKRPEMLIGPAWNKTAGEVIDASTQLSGLMLLMAVKGFIYRESNWLFLICCRD